MLGRDMPKKKDKKEKKPVRKKLLIAAVLLLLFFVVFVYCNNYCISTTYGIYNTNKVQDSIRIALLTDLHGKDFGRDNKVLSEYVLEEEPDMIIMSGDILSADERDISAAKALTQSLALGCKNIYFTFGNHESRDEDARAEMVSIMENAGATVLNNESIVYEKGQSRVAVYGLELPLYFYTGYDDNGETVYELETKKINQFIGESSDKLNILIAHNPIYFKEYAAWGADIVLSGHNHGGVIRIPFKGGIVSPNGGSGYNEYDAGEYSVYGRKMFLSRGLGEWMGPVRVFNLPEVYIIDIMPA